MKGKLKLNFLFFLFMIVASAVWIYKGITEYGLWDSAAGAPKDGFFPVVIATVLLIASIFNFISSFKEEAVTVDWKACILLGAIVLVYFFTKYIGFLPALFVFYVLWLKLYAKVNWKTTIIATAAMFVIIYFGFGLGLKIRFPKGAWLKLLG